MRNNHRLAPDTVTIIGAGLVGSLLAIYLARRGYHVHLFERRSDPRVQQKAVGAVGEGRSINLAISARGLEALERVDLKQKVLAQAIPMTGRMMHAMDGQLTYQAYGQNDKEHINSISRGWLNCFLLDQAEKMPGVKIHFNKKIQDVQREHKSFTLVETDTQKERKIFYEVLIGTDGSASAIRNSLSATTQMETSEEELSHGYKEFVMPSHADGGFQIEKNALHIWPRGAHMMIALPNANGSYTCTLFLPHKRRPDGVESFEDLQTKNSVDAYLRKYYPDFCERVPDALGQFLTHPTGKMVTLKCQPWFYKDHILLMGDASHAIVPFFGQGMNAGFEDVMTLDELLRDATSWRDVFTDFFELRKANTDAIADMAVENFTEMSSKTADPKFLYQKSVEKLLQEKFPQDYKSRYSLVSFSLTPYRLAYEAGLVQAEILEEITRSHYPDFDINFERARQMIHQRLKPVMEKIAAQTKG